MADENELDGKLTCECGCGWEYVPAPRSNGSQGDVLIVSRTEDAVTTYSIAHKVACFDEMKKGDTQSTARGFRYAPTNLARKRLKELREGAQF